MSCNFWPTSFWPDNNWPKNQWPICLPSIDGDFCNYRIPIDLINNQITQTNLLSVSQFNGDLISQLTDDIDLLQSIVGGISLVAAPVQNADLIGTTNFTIDLESAVLTTPSQEYDIIFLTDLVSSVTVSTNILPQLLKSCDLESVYTITVDLCRSDGSCICQT